MAFLLKLLTNRWLLAFAGMISIALCIWFIGPIIMIGNSAPLESVSNRLIAIAAIATIWLLWALFGFLRARRNNRLMLDAIAEQTPLSANQEATAEELAVLNDKMQDAIETLKQRNFSKKGGSRFLYELPWYTIIGPPGAGKTTLLSNSGLDFPLEESHGKLSVKGIGGTRNCDWWFTDQAVLLDTAGRYTTQDSEAEVDRNAWTAFLNMLKEKRPRRPLNGVLVAISLQDLLENDADALAQTAKTIRTRVEELYKSLGIAPPIYMMITKCDLMAGFSEFFADFDQEQRRQVWGFTLPVESTESRDALIRQELRDLGKSIHAQTLARMHRELSQRDRENIYTFPMQFTLVQRRVEAFTRQLTVNSSLLQNILFRGVYFTSATQTGATIDQVIATVSRSFGVDESQQDLRANSGKSYFINTLLRDVIFAESGLAGTNLKTERKLKTLQGIAAALIGTVLISSIALWSVSFAKNRAALQRVANTSTDLRQNLANITPESLDILGVEPALTQARRLAFGEDGRQLRETQGLIKRVGLYQGDLVDDAARHTYQELLIDALLPRLMVRLEHQMHAESTNSEFVFEALKTYQMMGDRTHFDSQAVIGWFNFDIDANLPSDTSLEQRNSLKNHFAALFAQAPYRLPRPLDRSLVRQYQQIASSLSLSQRAYQRLKSANSNQLNAYYRISDVGGPDIPLVFERTDGQSIDQSIPRFFTRAGYTEQFLPASENISQNLTQDAWVLGDFASTTPEQQNTQALQQAVAAQYYNEYIQTWESLLGALRLKPLEGLDAAARFISLVAEQGSPLKNLLVVAGEQTLLTIPEDPAAEDEQNSVVTDREAQLSKLLGSASAPATSPDSPVDPVTRHFNALHNIIANWEDNASQLDTVLIELANLNVQLLPMSKNQSGSMDPALGSDLAINLQKLETRATRMAEPLASLLRNLTNDIGDAAGGGFCQQLNAAWQAEVYGYYQRAIRNRYPVNRRGTADIALSDFGAFFGRDGIVDQFANDYLSAYVSRTPGQWTWTGSDSATCLSDASLKQLAAAEEIRNTFFSAGGQLPSFQFDVVPERLNVSSQIELVTLNVGNASMEFFHGPVKGSTSFRWPDASNNTQVSLRVQPVIPGGTSSLSMSGPWAILRLLDQGARSVSSGTLGVDFSFSGRQVSVVLATSSFNPLNSVALRNFRLTENL